MFIQTNPGYRIATSPVTGAGSTPPRDPAESFERGRPEPAICPRPLLVPGATAVEPASQAELAAAVKANNDFALDLHRQLAAGSPEGFFLAPSTVNGCLGMLLAGARDETRDGLAGALHLEGQDPERVHVAMAELQNQTRVESEGIKVKVSNRVFTQAGYPVEKDFQRVTRDVYGAEASPADFARDPEGARADINGLVSKDTNERIPELLPEGAVDGNSVMVLTSAIHFDGKWEARFPEAEDHKADFYAPGQSEPVQVDMMHLKKDFNYAAINLDGRPLQWNEQPDLKMVELPYEGGKFSRLVLVPGKVDGLAGLESQLTAENLASWTGQMFKDEVDVYFPKNESSSSFELKDTLTSMGAGALFESGDGLRGIGPGDLKVSGVYHKTFVKDSNAGTEFAGATGAVVSLECVAMPSEVRADRPFLTLVRDNETGAIVATQRVTRPEWKAE